MRALCRPASVPWRRGSASGRGPQLGFAAGCRRMCSSNTEDHSNDETWDGNAQPSGPRSMKHLTDEEMIEMILRRGSERSDSVTEKITADRRAHLLHLQRMPVDLDVVRQLSIRSDCPCPGLD